MTLLSSYIFLAALIVLYFWLKKKYPGIALKQSTFEVRLGEEKNIEEKNMRFYQLLNQKKIPFTLEVILHAVGEEIKFFITVDTKHKYTTQEILFSLFPDAKIKYDPFQDLVADLNHEIRAVALFQGKGAILPIKSQIGDNFSPFKEFLRALSGLKSFNESVGIQLIVKPADPDQAKEISNAVDALSSSNFNEAKRVLSKDSIVTKDSLKILEEKISHPLFNVDAKVIFTSDSKKGLDKIEEKLRHAFNQSASGGPSYNHIESRRIVAPKTAVQNFYSKSVNAKNPMLLNSKEIVELFYFTSSQIEKMPKLSSISKL